MLAFPFAREATGHHQHRRHVVVDRNAWWASINSCSRLKRMNRPANNTTGTGCPAAIGERRQVVDPDSESNPPVRRAANRVARRPGKRFHELHAIGVGLRPRREDLGVDAVGDPGDAVRIDGQQLLHQLLVVGGDNHDPIGFAGPSAHPFDPITLSSRSLAGSGAFASTDANIFSSVPCRWVTTADVGPHRANCLVHRRQVMQVHQARVTRWRAT